MAWKEVSVMSERLEFVVLASAAGANVSELCRRFGVSRKTGYKWLSRYATEGRPVVDHSARRRLLVSSSAPRTFDRICGSILRSTFQLSLPSDEVVEQRRGDEVTGSSEKLSQAKLLVALRPK